MEYVDICPRTLHPCRATCATATGMGGMNSPSTLNGSKPQQRCCCTRPPIPLTYAPSSPDWPCLSTTTYRCAGSDAVLAQALKLDLLALCPSLHLLFPELGEWLCSAVHLAGDPLGHMTCTSTFVMRPRVPEITLVDPYIITWLTGWLLRVPLAYHCSSWRDCFAGCTAPRSADTDVGNAQIISVWRKTHPSRTPSARRQTISPQKERACTS